MVRNPGKHQRSTQRCHDLGWKVHDRVKSFVHELRNQHFSIQWLVTQYGVNNYRTLCTVKAKKANKIYNLLLLQQRTLSCFITIPLY